MVLNGLYCVGLVRYSIHGMNMMVLLGKNEVDKRRDCWENKSEKKNTKRKKRKKRKISNTRRMKGHL
jgi:hypothetical protein